MDLRRLSTIGWSAGEAVAIAAFGIGLVAAAGSWLLSRIARRYGTDPTWKPGTTVQTFGKLSAKEYDDVRKAAAKRYALSAARQQQSAQIASGTEPPEGKLIEIVR